MKKMTVNRKAIRLASIAAGIGAIVGQAFSMLYWGVLGGSPMSLAILLAAALSGVLVYCIAILTISDAHSKPKPRDRKPMGFVRITLLFLGAASLPVFASTCLHPIASVIWVLAAAVIALSRGEEIESKAREVG
jgi:hypothetical protein